MVNAIHQGTLLFFYFVSFALSIAAIAGKSWIIDERKDNTGLLGVVDKRRVAYISLWKYYDWEDRSYDISDLYNGCKFRERGFETVRGFFIMGLITIVAQFALLLTVMLNTRKRHGTKTRQQYILMRVLQVLHSWSTFCLLITFAVFAGTVDRECEGIELTGKEYNYGWCYAFAVSVFVLFCFQLLALFLVPTTYFRVGRVSGMRWQQRPSEAPLPENIGEPRDDSTEPIAAGDAASNHTAPPPASQTSSRSETPQQHV